MARVPTVGLKPQRESLESETPEKRDIASIRRLGDANENLINTVQSQATEIGTKLQNRADKLAVIEADNELQVFSDSLLNGSRGEDGTIQGGSLNSVGKAAIGISQPTEEEYDKFASKRFADLSSRQKRMLQESENRRRRSLNNRLSKHEFTQTQVAIDNSEDASMNIAQANMSRNANDDSEIAKGKAKISKVMLERGIRKNWTKDETIANTKQVLSISHINIIKQRALTDEQSAASYYQRMKGQMEPKHVLAAEQLLDQASFESHVQKMGRMAYESSKKESVAGKDVIGRSNYSRAISWIESNMKPGKEKKAAIKEVDFLFGQEEKARSAEAGSLMKKMDAQAAENPNQPYDKAIDINLRKELKYLDPKAAAAHRNSFDDATVDRNKATEWMSRPLDEIKGMPWDLYVAEFRQHSPRSEWGRMQKRYEEAQTWTAKDTKFTEEGSINNQVENALTTRHIIGDDGSVDEDDQANYQLSVTREALEEIDRFEKTYKKKASPQERRDIIDNVIHRKPVFDKAVFDFAGSDAEKKDVHQMSATDLRSGDIYMSVSSDGSVVPSSRLGFVPAQLSRQEQLARQEIGFEVMKAYRERGITSPVDESLVDYMWSAAKHNRLDIYNKLFNSIGR